MSIISELKVQVPPEETITQICLSNQTSATLAVATYKKVLFYSENGEKYDVELLRSILPTALEWHPFLPVLAIGWESGLISLWNDETKAVKEDTNVHNSAITSIVFHQAGSRMVSCDEKGKVSVWKGLNCIAVYQKEGSITHCIFANLDFNEGGDKGKGSRNYLFFFGGKGGVVSLADDMGHCSEICKVSGAIKSLLFYEKENSVIIITSSLLFVQFRLNPNEKTAPDKKFKLSISGDPESITSMWVESGLLSTCSTESLIRFWNLELDQNYVLTLAELDDMIANTGSKIAFDKVITMRYDQKSKLLVAGTKDGHACFWKNMAVGSDAPFEAEQWKALPVLSYSSALTQISVSRTSQSLALKYGNGISMVHETTIRGKLAENIRVLQTASSSVQIYLVNELTSQMFLFDAKTSIRGLDCSNQNLIVWTGSKIEVHEIIAQLDNISTKLVNVIEEKSTINAIHRENILVCSNHQINVCNLGGVPKQTINFAENEGKIKGINILNNFMVIYTENNYIKLFDLSRREYKQVGTTRRFEDSTGPLGYINQCYINSDGSKVAIISNQKKGSSTLVADTKFFIYDAEIDNFVLFELGPNRVPVNAVWDQNDKRFFGVETEKNKGIEQIEEDTTTNTQINQQKDNETENLSEREFHTFFVTSENGIKKQDLYKLEKGVEVAFALNIPSIYLVMRMQGNDPNTNYQVIEKTMKDFIGLEKVDEYTKKAIMNFSFNLAISNMDEAYKSVKQIQNPLVWENMAQMCVKTKRLDVAEICLGNMRFSRGARAVRESKKEEELEVQLAMVAIQLNMREEAERLYQQAKRYDLLNKMYQADAEWNKSIQTAEQFDRINLKNTYYKLARQFEISRDFENAIDYYVKKIPRMLLAAGELEKLKNFINEEDNKKLYRWWAQYQESQKNIKEALVYYEKAEDFSSMVRIYLSLGNVNKSYEICLETGDPTGNFYMGKHMESVGEIEKAIQLYAKAQQLNHAVRLARESQNDNEVMQLSMNAPRQVCLQSAQYFEQKGYTEKAVILYIKGKNAKRALDLSVKHKLYDYIKRITSEVGEESDPETLLSVANHFLANQQFDKAIHLLIASKQIDQALELFIEHNIEINEDIVNKLLPEKNSNAFDDKKRQDLLRTIAKKAEKQGNFELASKKYMELGEINKAMKCLIKKGDTDTIIKFANNARMTEIYILAGNYLQNCDWHTNPTIMRTIIQFYSKAKSADHLANFFESCATIEIDEYRNYEKALSALKEALKYIGKSTNEPLKEQKSPVLETKITLVQQFIEAKEANKSNPADMLRGCQSLLENEQLEIIIRAGDVFAMMIEFFYEQNKMPQAYALIKKMQERGIILNPYLDQEMIENVFKSQGDKYDPNAGKKKKLVYQEEQENDDEDIEEIEEKF